MKPLLVRGKYVIAKTQDSNEIAVISDGAVYQENGKIVEVQPYQDLRSKHPSVEVVGSDQYVVLPGLVNAHYHQGFSYLQLGQPDKAMESISLPGAWAIDPYLEHLYGAVQMIESGTTTVQVIYDPGRGKPPLDEESTGKVIKAYLDAGMRVSYAPEIVNQNTTVAGERGGEKEFAASLPLGLAEKYRSFLDGERLPVQDLIAQNENVFKKYNGSHPRLHLNVAPGNVHRCSDDLLIELKILALKYRTTIHIHLQEVYQQMLYGLEIWGKSPLQHLKDLEFLGPELDCVHSVWVNDQDIDTMAEHHISVATNPSSNFRLQAGVTPVAQLLARGVRLALGTDECGLNDDKDMLQEMRLLQKVHRVPGTNSVPLTSGQVFKMATTDAAKVIGWGNSIGSLEPGMQADMVLMDLKHIQEPFLDPNVPLLDALLYRGRSVDVDTVIVEGEVVMRGRQFTRFDKEALYREIGGIANRPLDPVKSEWRVLSPLLAPYLKKFFAGTGTTQQMPRPYYVFNGRS
jgi:5-methylthioadenosine/S-adenosylhomocysteine deaminase